MSEPIIITEPLEITVLPSGSTIVVGLIIVGELVSVGEKVNVSPSVVIVVGVDTCGTVMVSEPMIIIEPLEITVLPSGSTMVVGEVVVGVVVTILLVGEKVKVCPSVVIVVGVET